MEQQFDDYEISWWIQWYRENFPHEQFTLPGGCLPGDCIETERAAYHFVKSLTPDRFDFKPRFFAVPAYMNSEDDALKCKALGISMYTSAQQARQRYMELAARRKGNWIRESLGTLLASCMLVPTDGLSDPVADSHGHYTHYPYLNPEFPAKFNTVEPV